MLAVLFPGQGSQRRGMGKELFPEFPALEREADAILGYSIRRLCVEDPQNQLGRTEFTQPAVYVVNALSYLARQKAGAASPEFLAGHSLGEFNALWVAGCFDFGTGLRLVKRRGELMAKASGGGMAAIVGLEEAAVRALLEEPSLRAIDLANLNTPKQFVLAGPAAEIGAAKAIFEKAGATFIALPVSAAFHSRYMGAAQKEFAEFLRSTELSDPEIPVISNVTAVPYEPGRVREHLVEQLRSSVRWCDSIRYLMRRGEMRFEEVGHGEVLTRMVAQIQREPLPAARDSEPRSSGGTARPAAREANLVPLRPVAPRAKSADVATRPATSRAAPTANLYSMTALVDPESLGSEAFRREYGLRLAYASGSMYRGIASEELVVCMARARLLSFFGTAGLPPERVEQSIERISSQLPGGESFGMNLLNTAREEALVDLFLRRQVNLIEASGYVSLSRAIVRYRALGLKRLPSGEVAAANRVVAKISRPEVAELFLKPAPERILRALVEARQITSEQAALAEQVPLADDLCVEADSGGHTDGGAALVLFPRMQRLRDRIARETECRRQVRLGLAGGIGTPDAVLAAFVLGADFVMTGSINQCTVEAGHSDTVKDMLEGIDVQDTDYAPAGDMFEVGAKVQVLKRGVFFPSRARRLLELYRNFPSLEALDAETRKQLESTYFQRSFSEVFAEVKKYRTSDEIERAEKDAHYKMGLVFKWYFAYTNQLAFQGKAEHKTNYQVHCGPALGAFNQWVAGTELSKWRARHVDDIAQRLMAGAANSLSVRLSAYAAPRARTGSNARSEQAQS